MTDREFEERLRGEYRAAASSWKPDEKTRSALLEKLEAAPPRREAVRIWKPAAALCCCAVIAAAALFALRQPQQDLGAVATLAEDAGAEAALFAAPAQGEESSGAALAAAAPEAAEAAEAAGEDGGAAVSEAAPKETSPARRSAAANGALFAESDGSEAASGARLTQEEIDALREQYPIAAPAAPSTAMIVLPSLSEVMERSDTFAYGEVVGVETVEKALSTGNESLDAKQQEAGAGTVPFRVLTLRVIEDTAGLFEEGEEISLWTNAALAEYGPKLTEGMRAVLPITAYDGEDRYDTCCIGTYYVTPEGFVLSAFDEEQRGGSWSGVLVEELLAALRE